MGGWNELESENKIIGPLIVSSRINYKKFAYFLEKELVIITYNYEL